MRAISPLADLGSRPPEAGRIRIGEQVPDPKSRTGKRMKSLTTFRFTSPDRDIIEHIARDYGGKAEAWNEPKANPSQQWQVTTTRSEIPVRLIPDGINTHYELWSGSGCVRRCDGLEVSTPKLVGEGWEPSFQPCLCTQENLRKCDPHTRLSVVLPDFAFLGVWRLESKGWNALEELPGMHALMLGIAQRGGMVDAVLSIEKRERITPTGKKKFVVPRLATRMTANELLSGQGVVALDAPRQRELTAGEPIEAEIIDDELAAIERDLADDANYFGLDARLYIAAVKAQAKNDRDQMRKCHQQVRDGERAALGFKQGRIEWRT